MDRERDEVFERIPWETLEQAPRDNSRLIIYLAGAVVVGSLAFALVRGQPPASPPPAPVAEAPATTSLPQTAPIPSLLAEADLYAVDHDRLAGLAMAHAEWFAVEYMSADGSEAWRSTLQALLPHGVPLPAVPEGWRVQVEWAGAVSVSELGPLSFEVDVLVRTVSGRAGNGMQRNPPQTLTIEIVVGHDGIPRVARPPSIASTRMPTPHLMGLSVVPEAILARMPPTHAEVVGGEPLPDGRWLVVVMVVDADGVTRPRSVVVP